MFGTILLVLLLILTAAILVTAGYHLVLRVPYVPTPIAVCHAMIALAELQSNETVLDLGAGDARLLIEAQREVPSIQAIGYELVPTIWLLGWLRILISKRKVTLLRRNVLSASLKEADVIFLYLMPSLMEKLEARFRSELRPGTRIVAHTFRLPEHEPDSERQIGSHAVRRYRW